MDGSDCFLSDGSALPSFLSSGALFSTELLSSASSFGAAFLAEAWSTEDDWLGTAAVVFSFFARDGDCTDEADWLDAAAVVFSFFARDGDCADAPPLVPVSFPDLLAGTVEDSVDALEGALACG